MGYPNRAGSPEVSTDLPAELIAPLHHLEHLLESCELTRASLESADCTFVANLEHVCTTGVVSESLLYSSS